MQTRHYTPSSLGERKVHSTFLFRRFNLCLLKFRHKKSKDIIIQIVICVFLTYLITSTKEIQKYIKLWFRASHPRLLQASSENGYTTRGFVDENYFYKTYVPHSRRVESLSTWDNKFDKDSKEPETFSSFEEGDCKAMHDWQIQYNPACNSIHELRMGFNRLINQGGFREVWYAQMHDGSPFVIKTLIYRKKLKFKEIDRHRRDANIYSMLQSSKHIPNIYGYCANSALFDVASQGTLEDLILDRNKTELSTWSGEDRLRYAWQAAMSLADLHAVGNIHNSSAICHTDISTDQFLWVNGMFQLNDFNRARFIRWNSVKQEPCKFVVSKNPGKNRSPEEYKLDEPLNEKIDVYSLGNIFYSIVVGEKVFDSFDEKESQELVLNGTVPEIPEELMHKFGDHEIPVVEAMKLCHVYDPANRSSARAVEQFLRKKLDQYNITKY